MTHAPPFRQDLVIPAPCPAVLEALSTLDGLAGWWTPTVTGDPLVGGELTFAFGDQRIVMRVDRFDPARVVWTCVRHTKFPEWDGTEITFGFASRDDGGSTELRFEHAGLVVGLDCYPDCSAGWAHYLASLSAFACTGEGGPWQSPSWRPANA